MEQVELFLTMLYYEQLAAFNVSGPWKYYSASNVNLSSSKHTRTKSLVLEDTGNGLAMKHSLSVLYSFLNHRVMELCSNYDHLTLHLQPMSTASC